MGPKPFLAAALALASSVSMATPGLIDFETVPGGVSADQLAISAQYQLPFGVTFSLSTGSVPFLEAVGAADAGNGFFNDALGVFDVAAPGHASQLKNFYLRIGTTTLQTAPMPQLVISYSSPVAAASAQIWDIDAQGPGTEQWTVQAYGLGGILIDTVVSPLGVTNDATSLDGKPWNWSFSHSVADIHEIRVVFTGSKTSGIGLAFDNFSPAEAQTEFESAVPEPQSLALAGAGLLVLALRQRKALNTACCGDPHRCPDPKFL